MAQINFSFNFGPYLYKELSSPCVYGNMYMKIYKIREIYLCISIEREV